MDLNRDTSFRSMKIKTQFLDKEWLTRMELASRKARQKYKRPRSTVKATCEKEPSLQYSYEEEDINSSESCFRLPQRENDIQHCIQDNHANQNEAFYRNSYVRETNGGDVRQQHIVQRAHMCNGGCGCSTYSDTAVRKKRLANWNVSEKVPLHHLRPHPSHHYQPKTNRVIKMIYEDTQITVDETPTHWNLLHGEEMLKVNTGAPASRNEHLHSCDMPHTLYTYRNSRCMCPGDSGFHTHDRKENLNCKEGRLLLPDSSIHPSVPIRLNSNYPGDLCFKGPKQRRTDKFRIENLNSSYKIGRDYDRALVQNLEPWHRNRSGELERTCEQHGVISADDDFYLQPVSNYTIERGHRNMKMDRYKQLHRFRRVNRQNKAEYVLQETPSRHLQHRKNIDCTPRYVYENHPAHLQTNEHIRQSTSAHKISETNNLLKCKEKSLELSPSVVQKRMGQENNKYLYHQLTFKQTEDKSVNNQRQHLQSISVPKTAKGRKLLTGRIPTDPRISTSRSLNVDPKIATRRTTTDPKLTTRRTTTDPGIDSCSSMITKRKSKATTVSDKSETETSESGQQENGSKKRQRRQEADKEADKEMKKTKKTQNSKGKTGYKILTKSSIGNDKVMEKAPQQVVRGLANKKRRGPIKFKGRFKSPRVICQTLKTKKQNSDQTREPADLPEDTLEVTRNCRSAAIVKNSSQSYRGALKTKSIVRSLTCDTTGLTQLGASIQSSSYDVDSQIIAQLRSMESASAIANTELNRTVDVTASNGLKYRVKEGTVSEDRKTVQSHTEGENELPSPDKEMSLPGFVIASQIESPGSTSDEVHDEEGSFPSEEALLHSPVWNEKDVGMLNANKEKVKESLENEFGNKTQAKVLQEASQIEGMRAFGLSSEICSAYKRVCGIKNLFPWQDECLRIKDVLSGHRNLVYSAPTSGGKSLVAEILMIKRLCESNHESPLALLIVPFISIVCEKANHLKKLLQPRFSVHGFSSGHGFSDLATLNVCVCTVEKGNAIMNRLISSGEYSRLCFIAFDELHSVGNSFQGSVYEILITKSILLQKRNNSGDSERKMIIEKEGTEGRNSPVHEGAGSTSKIQYVGLSATMKSSLSILTKWLGAISYETDFRPVKLRQHIVIEPEIFEITDGNDDEDDSASRTKRNPNSGSKEADTEAKKKEKRKKNKYSIKSVSTMEIKYRDKEQIVAMVANVCQLGLTKNEKILVFCDSRRQCEWIADQLEDLLVFHETTIEGGNIGAVQSDMEVEANELAAANKFIAYHHAGLGETEKFLIEEGFRNGKIHILATTSTLSTGINLPATKALILSPKVCFDDPGRYKQMSGRAGRAGFSVTHAESYLFLAYKENLSRAEKEKHIQRACKKLIFAQPKQLTSRLAAKEKGLSQLLLEGIDFGLIQSVDAALEYCQSTLLWEFLLNGCATEADAIKVVNKMINETIEFLKRQRCIHENENNELESTSIGRVISKYMQPEEGIVTMHFLHSNIYQKFWPNESLQHALWLTPVQNNLVFTNNSWEKLLSYVSEWLLGQKASSVYRRKAEVVKDLGINMNKLDVWIKGGYSSTLRYQPLEALKVLKLNSKEYQVLLARKLFGAVILETMFVLKWGSKKVQQTFELEAGHLENFIVSCSTRNYIYCSFFRELGFNIHADLMQKYRKQFRLCEFKALPSIDQSENKSLEDVLMQMPGMTEEKADALKRAGIHSIEELVGASHECVLQALRLGQAFVVGADEKMVKLNEEKLSALAHSLKCEADSFLDKLTNKVETQGMHSQDVSQLDALMTQSSKGRLEYGISLAFRELPKLINRKRWKRIIGLKFRPSQFGLHSVVLASKSGKYLSYNLRDKIPLPQWGSSVKADGALCKIVEYIGFHNFGSKQRNYTACLSKQWHRAYVYAFNKMMNNVAITIKRFFEENIICSTQLIEQIGCLSESTGLEFPKTGIDLSLAHWLLTGKDSIPMPVTTSKRNYVHGKSFVLDDTISNAPTWKDTFAKIRAVHSLNLMKEFKLSLLDAKLWRHFLDVEMQAAWAVNVIQKYGVRMVTKPLRRVKGVLSENIRDLRKSIHDCVYQSSSKHFHHSIRPFKLNSHRDIRLVLKVLLEQSGMKKTDESYKFVTTKKEDLIMVSQKTGSVLPLMILWYREFHSKQHRWVLALDSFVPHYSNRIYPSCNLKTATGRITISNPGLQNTPKAVGVRRIPKYSLFEELESQKNISISQIDRWGEKSEERRVLVMTTSKKSQVGVLKEVRKDLCISKYMLEGTQESVLEYWNRHGCKYIARKSGHEESPRGEFPYICFVLLKEKEFPFPVDKVFRKKSPIRSLSISSIPSPSDSDNPSSDTLSLVENRNDSGTEWVPWNKVYDLRIRECIIPENGHVFIAADFRQIELRLMAHFSNDSVLTSMINGSDDVFSVLKDTWELDSRNDAKQLFYSLAYGQGEKAMQRLLTGSNVARKAKRIHADFTTRFHTLTKYLKSLIQTSTKNGYVVSLLGRKRYLSGNMGNFMKRARVSVNTKIQASAADIFKLCLVKFSSNEYQKSLKLKLVIHDELIFSVPKRSIEKASSLIEKEMCNAVKLNVPLNAKISVGDNWGKLVSVEDYFTQTAQKPRSNLTNKSL